LHKTIYVTGITGFIGSNLLPFLLKEFDKVINFKREGNIEIISSDSSIDQKISEDIILNNPSSKLINLATLYDPYPKSISALKNLIQSNIFFPAEVINSLEVLKGLKVINAVSYHQLLDFKSQNIYSLSKELFKVFLEMKYPEIVNIYIFDTFGHDDKRNKVTDIFIKNILNGDDLAIPKNDIRINLSDCGPVCSSIINSIDLEPGDYCILSPNTISLYDLAKSIMEITNKHVKIIRTDMGRSFFDEIPEFPQNIFSSGPEYSFEDSLKNRIEEIENSLIND
jgi:nucleoside-diphosphate-sugar epimerase